MLTIWNTFFGTIRNSFGGGGAAVLLATEFIYIYI